MTLQYRGMDYSTASREGLRLIERAAETGSWFDIPEKLIELREIMQRHVARIPRSTRTTGFDLGGLLEVERRGPYSDLPVLTGIATNVQTITTADPIIFRRNGTLVKDWFNRIPSNTDGGYEATDASFKGTP